MREAWQIDPASGSCQYIYVHLKEQTLPDARMAIPLRRIWWALKKSVWFIGVFGPWEYTSKVVSTTRLVRALQRGKDKRRSAKSKMKRLNLGPGDWIEVKSIREIFATLDTKGQHRGLPFTKEMMKFCGKRYKVHKRLDKIILEATGELRTMKNPTVLLEDVCCDGEFHGNCDRSCFCFWRDDWLRIVEPPLDREGE